MDPELRRRRVNLARMQHGQTGHKPAFFEDRIKLRMLLLIFYFGVKGGAWLARKVDKVTIKAEELVLSTLVIVYGLFDLWLIFFYFFDFRLFRSHYYLIPILILVGMLYEWWAEKKLKNN